MELILITNKPEIAELADKSGVNKIMVDLEILGKEERQGHLDTLISRHTLEDVRNIRKYVKNAELLVRIDPINPNSKEQIDKVIEYGADRIMLPMFKTKKEVSLFLDYIDGRTKNILLLETSQAMVRIDDILELDGIDQIHIGLNDLHLGMGLKFMFELLSGGIVEYLGNKFKKHQIKWGFGGIGRLGNDLMLKPENILLEHKRLGSEIVILGRDFHNDIDSLPKQVKMIRDLINRDYTNEELQENKNKVREIVNKIVGN